jgi:putative addiction module component (TIGR02574 family)
MRQRALDILKRAVILSDKERGELAISLIDSLDTKVEEGTASAWNQEISRRIANLESRKASTVPWEEVQQGILTNLTDGQ